MSYTSVIVLMRLMVALFAFASKVLIFVCAIPPPSPAPAAPMHRAAHSSPCPPLQRPPQPASLLPTIRPLLQRPPAQRASDPRTAYPSTRGPPAQSCIPQPAPAYRSAHAVDSHLHS